MLCHGEHTCLLHLLLLLLAVGIWFVSGGVLVGSAAACVSLAAGANRRHSHDDDTAAPRARTREDRTPSTRPSNSTRVHPGSDARSTALLLVGQRLTWLAIRRNVRGRLLLAAGRRSRSDGHPRLRLTRRPRSRCSSCLLRCGCCSCGGGWFAVVSFVRRWRRFRRNDRLAATVASPPPQGRPSHLAHTLRMATTTHILRTHIRNGKWSCSRARAACCWAQPHAAAC